MTKRSEKRGIRELVTDHGVRTVEDYTERLMGLCCRLKDTLRRLEPMAQTGVLMILYEELTRLEGKVEGIEATIKIKDESNAN